MRMKHRHRLAVVAASSGSGARAVPLARLALPSKRLSPRGGARSTRGFSMVESLVALVIVSVGLLGVGQLTLTGLRETSVALGRTRAVYLLSDMMERIRANPDAEDAYDCASYVGGPTEQGCSPSGAPARHCSARELAEDDLARWQTQASDALSLVGSGVCDANVSYLASTSDDEPARYRIEVSWRERGSEVPITLVEELALLGGRSS